MSLNDHLDLGSLLLLQAVAKTGSITKAAEERGMSQPSASTRLQRLEQTTGVALLGKSPRGSRLTADGHRFMQDAEVVLEAMYRLNSTVIGIRRRASSILRIAASYTIAEYLMHQWLGSREMLGPDVQLGLEVGNSELVCELVSGSAAHLGFIETPSVPGDLDSELVAHDDLVLVVAPGHSLGQTDHLTVDELARVPLIMRESGSGTREYTTRQLDLAFGEAMPPPLQELGSTTAVKAAVMAGVGATIISRLTVHEELAEGRLRQIKLEGVDLTRQLRAVYPRGTRPTGAAAELVAAARRVGVPAVPVDNATPSPRGTAASL